MGFFDNIKKAVKESVQNGMDQHDLVQRWKKEESSYGIVQKKNYTFEDILQIISLTNQKKQIELLLEYSNTTADKRAELRESRIDINNQLENLKKGINSSDNNEITDNNNLSFAEHYIDKRNKRIALCISYLEHPNATQKGQKIALHIILLSSPIFKSYDVEMTKLADRFDIYRNLLKKFFYDTALDFVFFNHLITDTEAFPIDYEWGMDFMKLIWDCESSMKYYDETYNLHLQNINFYKLSETYSTSTKSKELEIFDNFNEWLSKKNI